MKKIGKLTEKTDNPQLEQLKLLAETSLHLNQLETSAEVADFVCQQIKIMIGKGYAGVSLLDETTQTLSIKALRGFEDDKLFKAGLSLAGMDPRQIRISANEFTPHEAEIYTSGRLELLDDGLNTLLVRKFPRVICSSLAHLLGVRFIYAMGFVHRSQHIGGVGILTDSESAVEGQRFIIESLVAQAAAILSRIHTEALLRESREKYRILLEESPDPIFSFTPEGRYTYANQALAEAFGQPVEAIIGKTMWDFFPKEEADRRFATLDQVFRTGKESVVEGPVPGPEGTRYYVTTVSPMTGADGKVFSAVCSSKNITERKIGEAKMELGSVWRRILIDQSRDGIVVLDGNGKVYEANQQFARMLGYSPEEVRNLQVCDWDYQFTKDQLSEMGNSIDEKGEIFETRHRRKDGTIFDVEISSNAATIAGQKLVFCVCRDISDRKSAEESLKEGSEFTSTLMNKMPSPMFVTNIDSSIRFVNPAFESLTGFSNSELMGHKVPYPWWPEESKEEFLKADNELRDVAGNFNNVERQHRKKNGQLIWVVINTRWVHSEDGPLFSVNNWIDITERKKTEEALRESEAFSTALLENAPNPIMVHNPDRSIKYVNPAWEYLTGYSSKEVLGTKPPYPYWLEEEINTNLAELHDSREQNAFKLVKFFRKRNNERFWVELTHVLVKNSDRKTVYHVTEWLNITEQKKASDALKDSEAKFRLAFMTGMDGNYLATLEEGLILEVNNNFERVFGYTREEAIGKTSLELGLYFDAADRARTVSELKAKGYVRDLEVQGRKKGGEIITVSLSIGVLILNNKKHILGIIRDITEHKKIEEALRESEARFRQMFEAHQDIMLFIEPEIGLILDANPAAVSFYGYSHDKLCKLNIQDINQLSPDQVKEQRLVALNKCQTQFVFPHRLANGQIRTVEVHSSPITINNRPLLFSIIHDVTERELAENSLRESEEKFQSVVTHGADLKFITDINGVVSYVSPQCEKVLGYPADKFLGQKMPDIVCPEDFDRYQSMCETVYLQKQDLDEYEYRILDSKQEIRWISHSVKFIRLNDNKILGVLNTIRDITRRKNTEEKVKQSSELLTELYQKEKHQREELEAEAKARGMFIDILGHELRTPLTPLIACSGMLQEIYSSREKSAEKKLAHNIYTSSISLAQRLEELLDLAKFSRGTFTLHQKAVKIADLIKITAAQFKTFEEQQSKQLVLELQEDLPEIQADPSRLRQVLDNLTSNAIKYSPTNTTVTLKARRDGSNLIIEVQDQGIGVSPEEQKQIFNPYHRVQQDTQKYPGIGLGLAVSRQIVEMHGGKIWVESQLGQGSSFIVQLPINQEPGGSK